MWGWAWGRSIIGNSILPGAHPLSSYTLCPTDQQILQALPSTSISPLTTPENLQGPLPSHASLPRISAIASQCFLCLHGVSLPCSQIPVCLRSNPPELCPPHPSPFSLGPPLPSKPLPQLQPLVPVPDAAPWTPPPPAPLCPEGPPPGLLQRPAPQWGLPWASCKAA